jgi:hypothetical protein
MRLTDVTWRGVHMPTNATWHFCGICGYNARYQAALVRHERVHTGEKPFKCGICDRRFTTKYWRQYHERNSHSDAVVGLVGENMLAENMLAENLMAENMMAEQAAEFVQV